MVDIIVAFPKIEDASKIKSLLIRRGFNVQGVCVSGAMAIQMASEVDAGVLICGCKLPDMTCREIKQNISLNISMLVLASKRNWENYGGDNIIFLEMPLNVHELLNTLEMMISVSEKYLKQSKEKKRRIMSDKDKKLVSRAKIMLMEKNNLTEEEAHRYIQKTSMGTGNSMADVAAMLLSMMDM